MADGEKPKMTGIAAVGAAFAALMMKGGMACGHAVSGLAKPATHVAEDVARAASHVSPGAARAVEEGGATVAAEVAGEAAARRAKDVGRATDSLVDSGKSLAKGQMRRMAREDREKKREEEEKAR